jgi:DUF4097 and DUF4098 domain-containing protein YvlB
MSKNKLLVSFGLLLVLTLALGFVSQQAAERLPPSADGNNTSFPFSALRYLPIMNNFSGGSFTHEKAEALQYLPGTSLKIEGIAGDVSVRVTKESVVRVRLKRYFESQEALDAAPKDFALIELSSEKNLNVDLASEARLRELDMKNRDHDVEVELPESFAGHLELQTISGDIRIEGLKIKSSRLKSISGDISLKGEVQSFEAKSISGNVELELASKLSAQLDLETTSGDIEVDDVEVGADSHVPPKSHRALFGADTQTKNKFVIQTISGDIQIERKEP